MQQLLTENLLLSLVGCGVRSGARLLGHAAVRADRADGISGAAAAHQRRRPGAGVRARHLGRFERGLRPGAGAPRLARRPERGARRKASRGSSGGRRRGRSALLVAEVGALDGAPRRRRPDDARLPARAARPARLRHRPPADRRHPPRRHEVLRQDAAGHEPGDAAVGDLLRPAARARARAARRHPRRHHQPAAAGRMDAPLHHRAAGRAPEPGKEPVADLNEVDAQLLDTLGIRLLRGPDDQRARSSPRPVGRGRQQDLRRSPFSRSGSDRSGDPDLDRSGG